MDIFSLAAKIKLDDDGFQRGITAAEKAGKSLGSSLQNTFSKIEKAAKVFLTGAAIKRIANSLLDLANATAEAGDRIDKQSQVLGLSRKAYQEWDYILGQNGASIDSMSASMKTLNGLILDAQSGGKEAKDAFAKLGLSIHDIENLNPEDQFEAVVRAFQKMPAGAKKSALAVQLFGRNGMELLPLLNQSSTSIDELRQRAQELGLIMSDEAVDAAVVYGDSLDDLKRTFTAFKYSIGSQLLPVMTNGIQRLTSYAGKLRNAYEEGGFAGVFKTLISDLKANWPSWSDISKWVTERWEGIQAGFTTIAKLVFGEDENGGIDWPTPEKWGAIVESKLSDLWSVVRAASGMILRLIFGTDADGNIDWPKADEWGNIVSGIIETLWETVKGAAKSILKLVFGEDAQGGIDWPDAKEWTNIVLGIIESLWSGIKSGAETILKLVFGEAEDGGIEWPDPGKMWEKVQGKFTEFWNNFSPSLTEFAKWAIGEIDLTPLMDPEQFWESIQDTFSKYWDKIVPLIAGGATWPIGMVVFGAAKDMFERVSTDFINFWNNLSDIFQANAIWTIGDAIFGSAAEMWERVSTDFATWWIDLAGKIEEAASWTIGKLILPSASYIIDQVMNWWNDNIYPNLQLYIKSPIVEGMGELIKTVGGYSSDSLEGSLVDFGMGVLFGNAKGNWNVPYDDFPALLHRNEMVLTASQARKYRDGEGSSVDMGQLTAAVVGAIREGMSGATVNSYLSGRNVTDDVNRNTVRMLKARRFAT